MITEILEGGTFYAPHDNIAVQWNNVSPQVKEDFYTEWARAYDLVAYGGSAANSGADGMSILQEVGEIINKTKDLTVSFEDLRKQAISAYLNR